MTKTPQDSRAAGWDQAVGRDLICELQEDPQEKLPLM